jgi:hypothetical protein
MKLQNAMLGMVAAVGIAGLAAAPALASISVVPGTSDPIPVQPRPIPPESLVPAPVVDRMPIRGTDDFIRTNGSVWGGLTGAPGCCVGVYGGHLNGAAGWYQIEVFGSEAAFQNTLEWNDGSGWSTVYTTSGTSSGSGDFVAPLVPKLVVQVFNPQDGDLPFRLGIGSVVPPTSWVYNERNSPNPNPDDPERLDPNLPNLANFILFTNPSPGSPQPRSSSFWFVNFDDGNLVDDDADDLNFRITRIPTPGALAVFGIALAGLGLARRRRATAA